MERGLNMNKIYCMYAQNSQRINRKIVLKSEVRPSGYICLKNKFCV